MLCKNNKERKGAIKPTSMKQEFNKWMAKIGNIYYADDELMAKAFKNIEEYEKV